MSPWRHHRDALRILLVEDDPSHAELIRAYLADSPERAAEVTHASRFADAEALVSDNRHEFDCVVLDLGLPDTEGFEAVEVLRWKYDLPVVILTGRDDTLETSRTAVRHGAQDYLSKAELGPALLHRAISHAIERFSIDRELEQSNRRLATFASTVSHDLKSPLAVVTGQLEILAMYGKLEGKPAEMVEEARIAARRLAELIDDLLVRARDRAGDTAAFTRTRAAVDWALENLAVEVEREGAEIVVGEMPEIEVDPIALRHTFQNLVANALRYHSPDRPPRIEIKASSDGPQWRFCVSDNGIGIADDIRDRVFDPGFRGDEEATEGSGVGLAACRRHVRDMGGHIWVEPTEGPGTTVCFTVPDIADTEPAPTRAG